MWGRGYPLPTLIDRTWSGWGPWEIFFLFPGLSPSPRHRTCRVGFTKDIDNAMGIDNGYGMTRGKVSRVSRASVTLAHGLNNWACGGRWARASLVDPALQEAESIAAVPPCINAVLRLIWGGLAGFLWGVGGWVWDSRPPLPISV